MIPLNLFTVLFDPAAEPFDWSSKVGKEYIAAIESFVDELVDAEQLTQLVGNPIFDAILEYANKHYDAKTYYGNLNWFLSDLEHNFGVPLHMDKAVDSMGDPYLRYTFMSPKTTYIVSWIRNFHGRLYVQVYTPELVEGVELNISRAGLILKEVG